ncbi:hypothetical protein E2I00_007080, partial [Balaenoptera physalus]
CEEPPAVLLEVQGTLQRPVGRDSRSSPANCTWLILGSKEQTVTLRFQKLRLACGSERLILRSPIQPQISLCEAPASPLQLPGGNVTITYSYAGARAPMGQGFLLSYSQGGLDRAVCSATRTGSGSLREEGRILPAPVLHSPSPWCLCRLADVPAGRVPATVDYHTVAWSSGRGFNATYHVRGYCLPWDRPCGLGSGLGASEGLGERCYSEAQRCDGSWDCADGTDEENCPSCPPGHYPCGAAGTPGATACYLPADRCNYQTFCADGADERRCRHCQPGNFRCRDEKCVYETWVCDGQPDCADGSDEWDCSYALPRKVITAAVIGSLVCGLLLVIALGCTCKLYAIRTQEYSIFAPLSRTEAEIVQQQAPPSYGQLIAQGAIPPVEDFPTENPNDNSVLGNLRSLLQILRQDMTPGGASGTRRRQRGRSMRRLVRRLRRWGLLPRTSPPARTSETRSQVTPSAAPPETLDGSTGPAREGGAVGGQDGEQAPPLPVKAPLPPASTSPAFPTVPEAPGPLPAAPLEPSLLSGVDEDDVLLVPLAEPGVWVVEAEDEPLLA